MKRKLTMILALTATFTIMTTCNNTSENTQAEIDKNMIVTESATATADETEFKQEIPVSEETDTTNTTDTTIERSEPVSVSTIEYQDIEMPVPFENEVGDLNADFYSTVNLKLGYIDMSFVDFVGVDEFENWLNNTSSSLSELTSVGEVANLYSFIKHFDVPSDFVRENLVNMRNGSADDFSDEEIDLIVSDDDEAVARHFAADTAILKGSNIYSLKWVYYHTPADYAANGITVEELETALPMFDRVTLTSEAEQAIEMKINSYAAIASENLQ
ncbi:MAG: hypothetical protein NC120_03655 [Ruminococcus sp.]|nr:hypothetical protein [Ruminococcus sp.]